MKKYRLPRKDKKKIPKGMYCYVFNGSTGLTTDGRTWYGTNTCTFYQHDEEDHLFGYCKLVKGEIMDQCKSCGVKY